jgi:lipoprotein
MSKTLAPLLIGAFALALTGTLVSCGKNTPKPPVDERQNKGHDNPTYAELTLTEATLKAGKTFSTETTLDDVDLSTEAVQKIGLDNSGGTLRFIEGPGYSKKFTIESTAKTPNRVYLLKIAYKNLSGQLMNDQLISDEQINRHQHFFKEIWRVRDNNEVDYAPSSLLSYRYAYCDVFTRKKANGTTYQERNPVGFTGLIQFVRPRVTDTDKTKELKMVITLAHFYGTKFKDGSVLPFHTSVTPGADTDINMNIDFTIKAN